MADVNKSIQSLTINVKEIQLQIKKLYEEGQSAEKVFDKVKDSFQNITKEAIKLTESSKQALSKKDPEAYAKAITKINSLFAQLISSYKGVTSAANQANAEYEAGFKKLLIKKATAFNLDSSLALTALPFNSQVCPLSAFILTHLFIASLLGPFSVKDSVPFKKLYLKSSP